MGSATALETLGGRNRVRCTGPSPFGWLVTGLAVAACDLACRRAVPPPHSGPFDAKPAGGGEGEEDRQSQQFRWPEGPVDAVGSDGQVDREVHEIHGVREVAYENEQPDSDVPRSDSRRADHEIDQNDSGGHCRGRQPPYGQVLPEQWCVQEDPNHKGGANDGASSE